MDTLRNYTISEVIELTGATEFLLRTWELRYKLVTPKRTETGRRLYSSSDVLRISKIVTLLAQGHKIGKIAHLKLTELQDIEKSSEHHYIDTNLDKAVLQVFQFLSKTEWDAIKKIFEAEMNRKTPLEFLDHFIMAVAQQMSYKSLLNQVDIIQEHILSSLIKEYLYKLGSKAKPKNKLGQIFLFATVEGDHHDLGLLISKVIAEVIGYKCIYLGSHVPKKDLVEACLRLKPSHVVIGTSITINRVAKENLLKYIHFIDKHLPDKTHLWLGGYAVNQLSINLNRSFAVFKSLDDYKQSLIALNTQKGLL